MEDKNEEVIEVEVSSEEDLKKEFAKAEMTKENLDSQVADKNKSVVPANFFEKEDLNGNGIPDNSVEEFYVKLHKSVPEEKKKEGIKGREMYLVTVIFLLIALCILSLLNLIH